MIYHQLFCFSFNFHLIVRFVSFSLSSAHALVLVLYLQCALTSHQISSSITAVNVQIPHRKDNMSKETPLLVLNSALLLITHLFDCSALRLSWVSYFG